MEKQKCILLTYISGSNLLTLCLEFNFSYFFITITHSLQKMCNLHKSTKKKKSSMIPLFTDNHGYYFYILLYISFHVFPLTQVNCTVCTDIFYFLVSYILLLLLLSLKYVCVSYRDECFIYLIPITDLNNIRR